MWGGGHAAVHFLFLWRQRTRRTSPEALTLLVSRVSRVFRVFHVFRSPVVGWTLAGVIARRQRVATPRVDSLRAIFFERHRFRYVRSFDIGFVFCVYFRRELGRCGIL